MKSEFEQVIDQSIDLELNISDLYLCFHKAFEEDKDFWWQLFREEENHASLIRTARDVFKQSDKFPQELLYYNLDELKETNDMLASLIKQYKEKQPLPIEAFAVALEVENSAAEMHYQEFMHKDEDSQIIEIFHRLNQQDKDHYLRIQTYMQEKGIELYQAEPSIV